MSGGTLAEALRAFAGRRAAGGIRPVTPPRRPVVPADPAHAPDLAPAGPLLSVRREVGDLLGDSDLALDLRAALEAISAADPETLDRGLLPARDRRLEELAFLDLETTGFWGCPVLLVGLLHCEDGVLVTRQLVARDYPGERELLAAALEQLSPRGLVVTFNGKSYDLPCFRERCIVHRLADAVTPHLAHVDLLHIARRLWRGRFANCRLVTLERHVVGFTRVGDVPSAEIPALFHRFVRTGDMAELRPVLHHGRVDLLTTAGLFAAAARLAAAEAPQAAGRLAALAAPPGAAVS